MASPVIPKDQLSAYQRWELGTFDLPTRTNTGRRAEDNVDHREQARKEGHSEGYSVGHREGFQAGHREALAEMAPRIAVMEQLIAALKTDLARLDQELATDVVQLGLAVAKNLVASALHERPQIIQDGVEQALKQLAQNYGPVHVVVHPQDAELVRGVLETAQLTGGWSLKEDEGISRGGCKVETAAGDVDATLETRWHRTTAALGQPVNWTD
jgi:flagellar assembly protein FliH